ncbi:MAG: single-stranded-DNA-specific exonuclease RecJ [Campylobacter sp.]|nr:single-stranded-DNA-specific exonuclease RecJ [Campylobacter sp.]
MIGKKELKKILEQRFSGDIHKTISEIPLPYDLKDSYKAAYRIQDAILSNERICIVGDYDVDGIVSSVIMSEFFEYVGANYFVKIPNRFIEGYGLNPKIIEEVADDVSLIVTVDNGISAVEAGEICNKKGIDLIITDHHTPPPVLPKAYAIVNPKQSDCTFPNIEICGAEVAWYVVGALKDLMQVKYDMGRDLDLLLVAIIADMMELRDMNRVLVKLGIKRLNSSSRPCFRAIKEYYGKDKFEFDDISFLIAPLINSTGRMDDANLSYEFLFSKDIRKANTYLDQIVKINNHRKEEERNLYEHSLQNIKEDEDIIVTWGENWHEGVIGIVASRLSKHYKKPAIVFSIDGNRAKGSARSVGKFDILKTIANNKELLVGYGGHRGAAGIVIEPKNLEIFKNAINKSCFLQDFNALTGAFDGNLGEIDLREFDIDMLKILEYFEPYGQKNPRPIFEIKDAKVMATKLIGKDQNHLKITVEKFGISKDALFFNFDYKPKDGDTISLMVSATKNSFRGVITPEFIVKEILR